MCTGRVLLSVLTWIVSPIMLGCLVMLLVFWLIVVQGQRVRFRREKTKLRIEFDSYRREMQAKVRPWDPSKCLVSTGKANYFWSMKMCSAWTFSSRQVRLEGAVSHSCKVHMGVPVERWQGPCLQFERGCAHRSDGQPCELGGPCTGCAGAARQGRALWGAEPRGHGADFGRAARAAALPDAARPWPARAALGRYKQHVITKLSEFWAKAALARQVHALD